VVPICKILPEIEQRDTLFSELENQVVEKTRSASLQNVVNVSYIGMSGTPCRI